MPRYKRSRTECSSSLSCERPSFCHPTMLLPLLLTRCFLLGDGCASRTFARARICVRALAAHRQPPAMPQSAIRADVHQPLDVHLNAFAQIALDLSLRFEDRTNATQLVFAQIADARVETYLRLVQDRRRPRSSNSVNVCETDLCALIGRKVYTCYTSHLVLILET